MFEKKLGIYNFKWKFLLIKIDNIEISDLLVQDIIQPLIGVINGLQNLNENIKLNYIDLENQYL